METDRKRHKSFYIGGEWVQPDGCDMAPVVHPGDGEVCATIAMGNARHVGRAVEAAVAAFAEWSGSSVDERLGLLQRITDLYKLREDEFAYLMSLEMGTCLSFSRSVQAPCGHGHLEATMEALKSHVFERPSMRGGSILLDESVGPCGLITPWNWPINQVMVKVAPALAAGCTMVLKPSELSPLSALLLAEVIDEAGCPPGVFNLVNGDGEGVGVPMSRHPNLEMISFTGSTRAGIAISNAAADTVKRVTLELGGKSPNLVFADADLDHAAQNAIDWCFINNGQSCDAPSRLLVEREIYNEMVDRVTHIASNLAVEQPLVEGDHLGPVVSQRQYDNIQKLIQKGIDEGAKLTTGGTGLAGGFNSGFYVKPTVFADVHNDMTIAREEIFGPVLSVLPFDTEEEAIEIANDTVYGLSAFISSSDGDRTDRVSRRLRAGSVNINGAGGDYDVPFGGIKQSGNGKEQGSFGLGEYLETKAINR